MLARSYGFESRPKLKAAVDGVNATKLHEAVDNGDVETARELLTRRPEIVDFGRGEMSALVMAVLRRDLAMTRLLLEFGADPNKGIWPIRADTNPTVIARDRVYDEISEAIHAARVKRGMRRPEVASDSMQKLRQAFLSGKEEAIVAVFDEYPELAQMSPAGVTLLHQSAGRGALKLAKWLIDHGANVDRKSNVGWTPLDFAASGQGQ